ncbi:hypothetical protein [Poriferisphaera corsica]|nr:hypothetical protein [Poriferisphaera corsica]
MAQDTTTNTIRENAAGPRKASGDSESVEQHSLQDQIVAGCAARIQEGQPI